MIKVVKCSFDLLSQQLSFRAVVNDLWTFSDPGFCLSGNIQAEILSWWLFAGAVCILTGRPADTSQGRKKVLVFYYGNHDNQFHHHLLFNKSGNNFLVFFEELLKPNSSPFDLTNLDCWGLILASAKLWSAFCIEWGLWILHYINCFRKGSLLDQYGQEEHLQLPNSVVMYIWACDCCFKMDLKKRESIF